MKILAFLFIGETQSWANFDQNKLASKTRAENAQAENSLNKLRTFSNLNISESADDLGRAKQTTSYDAIKSS